MERRDAMPRGHYLHSAVVTSTLLLNLITLIVTSIQAAEVHLAWDVPETDADPSTLATPVGYKVYYGPSRRSYDFVLDVGNVASIVLNGLEDGHPYYITVAAYDSTGVESEFSNEVMMLAGGAPTVPEGLVAAYSFDEGSGATVTDASGNGYEGVISGALWTSAGRFGSALLFDGIDDLVTMADSPSLQLSSGMTLSAWVYPTGMQSGWRTIVQIDMDAYSLYASGDMGALHPAGGGTFDEMGSYITGPAAIPVNAWSHLALTYDGESLRLYANGEEISSRPQMGRLEAATTLLQIGGNASYGGYFAGQIDEVHIYNRELSPSEIQADMDTPVK
jgi:concanavalin A-like lectin/glucanase superfamily protein/fibronectin type III domain protein